MGLSEVQRTLALLLTKAELRDRLRAGTESANAVAVELGLNGADLAQVQHFAMAELERSARSLHAKRWQEIQKLLPLSLKAASLSMPVDTVFGNNSNGSASNGNNSKDSGPGELPSTPGRAKNPLFPLFRQFAETYVPGGSKRHANDAIAFANWVNAYATSTPCPPWLTDLLRYEATWLRLHSDTRPRFLYMQRYRYPVPKIATTLTQTTPNIGQIGTKSTLLCWLRLSPKTDIRMIQLF